MSTFLYLLVLVTHLEGCRIVIWPPRPKPTLPPSSSTTKKPIVSSSCQCGVSSVRSDRIVGGEPATKNEFPWQAAFVSKFGSLPFCGGSLVSSNTVLTAAHCETFLFLFRVHLGEHDVTVSDGELVVNPAAWINHPNYNGRTNDNDFAVVRLADDVNFSSSIKPVCLPLPDRNYDQRESVATGWGTLFSGGPQPNILHKVGLTTITNTECATNTQYSSAMISSSMICARESGKDSCQGDSGGPLITPEGGGRFFSVIGVVSWGFGCALPTAPDVYARVTAQLSWIEAQIQGRTCNRP